MKRIRQWSALLLFIVLTGCSALQSGYDKPEVPHIIPQPGENGARFLIGLRVLNPNREALDINGVYFNLRLQGNQVISGITNKAEHIEAYGERLIELQADTSLLSSLRTLMTVIGDPSRPLEYRLETRVDTNWWRFPVTLVDNGRILLGETRS